MKQKSAIYIRVSTEDQVEGYSLDAQERALTELAEKMNLDIYKIYVDGGISGKTIEARPQLLELLKDADNQLFNIVLIYKLDRLSRNIKDAFTIIDRLRGNDIGVKSYMDEAIDTTTATQRAMFGMRMVFAQFEIEQLSERVAFGMTEALKQGNSVFGEPYGYRKGDNGKPIIHDEEAKVVKLIYEKFLENKGINMIAGELNDAGIKTQKGSLWLSSTVGKILNLKTYYGEYEVTFKNPKRTERFFDVFPPIIDKKTFDNVQELIKLKKELHPRTASLRNSPIFTGRLICAKCGSTITSDSCKGKQGRRRYRCTLSTRSKKKECPASGFYEDSLESLFVENLSSITASIDSNNFNLENSSAFKSAELNRQLLSIRKKRDKTHHSWENDLISDEYYTSRMKELNTEETTLIEKLSELDANPTTPKLFEFENFNISDNWSALAVDAKKKFVLDYIDKITVDTGEWDRINNLGGNGHSNISITSITLR